MKTKKKTIITVSAIFICIIAMMLALVPVQMKNERYSKWGKLAELAETDEKARYIIENEELYPDEVIDIFYNNFNELEFVYDYPNHKNDYSQMTFTDEELNSETVPALYMNDYRWAYEDNFNVKFNGCAAVSLTMANLRLNHNSDVDPIKIMRYAKKMDYIGFWGGINAENIKPLCEAIGLNVSVTNFSENMKKKVIAEPEMVKSIIDSGHVAMTGMSGETWGGHAIIIRDYDGDSFFINDPANPHFTDMAWSFDTLEPEMMYLYDLYV